MVDKEKAHISVSQLRQFTDCPRRWHYKQVHPHIRQTPIKWVMGGLFHDAVAFYYGGILTRIATIQTNSDQSFNSEIYSTQGKIPSQEDLVKRFETMLTSKRNEGELLIAPWDTIEKYRDPAVKALRFWYDKVRTLPRYKDERIVAVEERLRMPLNDEYDLVGIVDLITKDVNTGAYTLTDWKLTYQTPNNMNPEYKAGDKKAAGLYLPNFNMVNQFFMYYMLAVKKYCTVERYGLFEFMVAIAKPKRVTIPVMFKEIQEVQSIADVCTTTISMMQASRELNEWFPNYSSMSCGPYLCPFYNRCHDDVGHKTNDSYFINSDWMELFKELNK